MNTLPAFSWLNAPIWLPLLYALSHTLWQGALAAGGAFLILRFVPTHRASLRYGLSAAALALVVLMGLGSWALLDAPRHSPIGTIRGDHSSIAASKRFGEGSAFPISVVPSVSIKERSTIQETGVRSIGITADTSIAKAWVQWVAASWLLGVFASLLRTAKGTLGASRLRRRCRDLVDPRILALVEDLRTRLGVSRRVRFLVCDEVGVPSMLGILYPAVLLPASMLTGVPLEQLRAVLAHELAHIRRWDYLANLAQMLVEALLFFNPFVWWLSRQMRLEREACCDQVAAGECQSPASYVEALVAVVERNRLDAAVAPPVLAASGPDAHGGNTLERARRLLVPGYQPAFRIRWYSLAAVLVLSVFILSGLWLGTRAVAQTIQAAEEKNSPEPADNPNAPAAVPGLPNDVLAAAREGNAKQALSLLEASFKPKKFSEEDAAHTLDSLIRSRELRAFTTLYDSLRHFYAKDWKLSDELLAGLVKDQRTDFFDALLVRRFDLNRLTKAGESAEPATAAWIARRVAEVTKQHADIEALEKAAMDNDLPGLQRLVDGGADVNGIGKDDNTPLIRAVFKNHLEAAQWLLDHGAQVDKPRLPGWNYTPLCLVNSVPMAELLKKYGANVHAQLYERDESILTYVAMWTKADVVAWFLKQGLDARMTSDNQENLLFGLEDGATAEVLLEAGADPNRVDESGRTPLTAAHSGAVVRALVRHGADLHPKLKDGMTLLEYAAFNTPREHLTPEDDDSYIDELIKQGAEFDPKGNGVKALLSAAFSDRVGQVQAFLDHGVSPNASLEHGSNGYRSALSQAAWQAPKSLKLLLARGADPNAPVPTGGLNSLSTALLGRNFDNADLLRQAGAKGVSDLAYYSARGNAAKVSELLDGHADPNEKDSSGQAPLSYALQHAEVEVTRRLLDHGASVDHFNAWGFSPYLDFALYQQMMERDPGQAQQQWHLPITEAKARLAAFQQLFTQHPPDPTYRDASGRTALHQAAWGGNSFGLGVMLTGKPPRYDPNLPDKDGQTPLLLAALSPVAKETEEVITTDMDTPQQKKWNRQAHLIVELLEAGARLDLVVADGKSVGALALAAARDANNEQLVAVLTDALNAHPDPKTVLPTPTPSATLGSPAPTVPPGKDAAAVPGKPPEGYALRNAAGEGRIETVRALLDHGANINFQDEQGFTSLSWAAYCGKEDVCLLLLERGADGRIEDHDGRNAAWHAAAGQHCVEALTRMTKAGVPVTGKDKRGDTILNYMMNFGAPRVGDRGFPNKVYTTADIERFDESERRVVELLLAVGVDPNGGGGDVPLIRAMHNSHYGAARVLLSHGADPARKDKDGNTALYELIGYVVDRPLPLDLFKMLWQRSGSPNPEFTVEGVTPPTKTSLLEMIIEGAGVINGAGPDPKQRPSFREAIKIMLDGGVTFAGVVDANTQALLQAAARGDLAAIQRSVGQGAPVSAADDGDWDALSLTTALGYNECADWLIDHGADLNGHHREPWNAPLPHAIMSGQADLVEKMLAKGATLDSVYRGLYTAVRLKNPRIFEALLKAGADPKEKPGVTVTSGGKTYTPHDSVMLYLCIKNEQTDIARTLLDRGADADPPNLENDRNLAWWAVDYDRPEILQSLLDHGANLLQKDDTGVTALDIARKHHPKLVPMLEEAAKRKSVAAM